MPATIAVFAYKRPRHLQRCLEALAANDQASESDLRIFVDGPRGEDDAKAVADVVEVANSALGFKSVSISEAEENLGLAGSLTSGITKVLATEERVIVVEDDILTSRQFLNFMNDHLDAYSDDNRVASIHGYTYPHPKGELPATFFIKGADCWGWATWRRAWRHFNPDGQILLDQLKSQRLLDDFTFGGTAPFDDMLIDQIAGRNDSWAVCWYASALLAGMHTLYPDHPLATNIGEDGSGTHGGTHTSDMQELSDVRVRLQIQDVRESPEARRCFEQYFRARYRIPRSSMGRLLWRYVRRLRQRLLRRM